MAPQSSPDMRANNWQLPLKGVILCKRKQAVPVTPNDLVHCTATTPQRVPTIPIPTLTPHVTDTDRCRVRIRSELARKESARTRPLMPCNSWSLMDHMLHVGVTIEPHPLPGLVQALLGSLAARLMATCLEYLVHCPASRWLGSAASQCG